MAGVSDPQHRDTDWFEEWAAITNDEGQPEHDDDIAGTGDAERRMWVVRRLRSDLAEIDSHAAQEIERIEAWANEQREKIAKQTEWLEAGLLAYLKGTGKKTLKLVSGTLKWREGRERVVIEDEKEFIETASDIFISRKTTVKPDRQALLLFIRETGGLPDGVDLARSPGTFTVHTPNEGE